MVLVDKVEQKDQMVPLVLVEHRVQEELLLSVLVLFMLED